MSFSHRGFRLNKSRISLFHFNPKASLGNNVYELQPLTTEGEKPYKRWNLAIPIGGGLKFSACATSMSS